MEDNNQEKVSIKKFEKPKRPKENKYAMLAEFGTILMGVVLFVLFAVLNNNVLPGLLLFGLSLVIGRLLGIFVQKKTQDKND